MVYGHSKSPFGQPRFGTTARHVIGVFVKRSCSFSGPAPDFRYHDPQDWSCEEKTTRRRHRLRCCDGIDSCSEGELKGIESLTCRGNRACSSATVEVSRDLFLGFFLWIGFDGRTWCFTKTNKKLRSCVGSSIQLNLKHQIVRHKQHQELK